MTERQKSFLTLFCDLQKTAHVPVAAVLICIMEFLLTSLGAISQKLLTWKLRAVQSAGLGRNLVFTMLVKRFEANDLIFLFQFQ